MRDGIVAEWILRLVTTPDRAASIAGDLLEEASSRGIVWFWLNLFGTVASQLFEELRDARLRMLWLAVSGLVESWFVTMAFLNIAIQVWMRFWPHWIAPNAVYIPAWGYYALLYVANTVGTFLVGWDVARRSDRRELPAGIAATLAFGLFVIMIVLTSGSLEWRYDHPYPHVQKWPYAFCAFALFFMSGALFRRTRANRRYFGNLRAGR